MADCVQAARNPLFGERNRRRYAVTNPDFASRWRTPATRNGPAFSAVADTCAHTALTATAPETLLVTVDLGSIPAGEHQIAVPVRTSSDTVFALRLFSDSTEQQVQSD